MLVFSIEFPPHVGGAATYALNLAVGLASIGCEVRVLTISRKSEIQEQAGIDRELLEMHGIVVQRVPFVPKLYLLVAARALRRLIREREFSALIVADSGAQKCAAYFCHMPSIPVWTIFHGSEITNYFGKSTLALRLARAPSRMRSFFQSLTGCIAVSEWTRSSVTRALPELLTRCQVVHHGVSVNEQSLETTRSAAKSRLGIDSQMRVVFTASRLIEGKGQDVLVRAFAAAVNEEPSLHLLIAGEGPVRPQLEALARSEGVAGRVTFKGRLDKDQMGICYRACDVFVQLSRIPFESFGLVYLEANACERAVIAGNVGGVPESVGDGVSGCIIDPQDAQELRALLLRFVRDKAFRSRLEASALERVRNEFSLEAMARRTADLVFSRC